MNNNPLHQEAYTQQKNRLSGKRILITGAGGFIGSHLLAELRLPAVEIHATSRSARTSGSTSVTWWQGSMQDFAFAEKVFSEVKPDLVFHLSGEVTAANDMSHVLTTYHSLLTSTLNILTLAGQHQCARIVLTGSSTEPLSEDPVPNSPYAAAKWATRVYGQMFQRMYNLPVVVVRPFMGYGPAQPAGKIIPFVIRSFLAQQAPLLSNGNWLTDWVYIQDMVAGIVAAGAEESLEGSTIDLGSGTLTSVREVIEKLTDIMQPQHKPVFGALPDRHQEHTRTANTELAFHKLKWKAQTSLEEGLMQTVNWFKASVAVVIFGALTAYF